MRQDVKKGDVPDYVKWDRQVLYFHRLGVIDSDMVVRCDLLREGATSGTMALKGRGHKTHWTEDQIAKVWGLSPKQARVHLNKLRELGLLGFWRGNKRLPAERWLVLSAKNVPPGNWPWGAFVGLSSPVVKEIESGSFGLRSAAESGEFEATGYPTLRGNDSRAEPNGSRLGVNSTLEVISVAMTPGVDIDAEKALQLPVAAENQQVRRDDGRGKKRGPYRPRRAFRVQKQPGAGERYAGILRLALSGETP